VAPNTAAPQAAPAAVPVPIAPAPAGMLRLPILVFGIVEVRRLKRELESLEEYMSQSELRTAGKQAALPRVSRLLDALATENHMNLLQPEHRAVLQKFLVTTEKDAPLLHISFAADPSSAFTAKMVKWLRANIAPDALMEVGLQPTIAAGCIVRTTNKVFDMSLRSRFADADGLLMQALEKAGPAPEVAMAAPAVPAAAPATAVAAPAPLAAPTTNAPSPQQAAVPPAPPAGVAQ
jgi:F0F1-type ATP synthase delta subunit